MPQAFRYAMPETLDKSVRWRIDHRTLPQREPSRRTTIEAILSSGLATEVVGLLSAGKEADVYLAGYGGDPIAVKVYRLFRTSRRGGGGAKLDRMSRQAAREYDALFRAWKAGAPVPTPARRVENMVSMRYLGDDDGPAPRLQDVPLRNPKEFLDQTLTATKALVQGGQVHGDLSAFNILVHASRPWFIDFSDAIRVDRLGISPWKRLTRARTRLRRDLQALQVHFRRYGLSLDVEGITSDLVRELDVGGLLG
ncbi:MAG: RIO1 family regulatory kinase/ATPase [Thermoplasmata archaeon]